jgi:hypothetical protein
MMDSTDYSKCGDEDFDRILVDIANEHTGAAILTIPGVYEILSEEFNDEVLTRWTNEQEAAEQSAVGWTTS